MLDNPTLLALLLVAPLIWFVAFIFGRIRRQVRFERKLQQATVGKQSMDHEETVRLLEENPGDVSLDKTLYRFIPSLSKTRLKLRRAGIGIDIKVYVFGLLAAIAVLLQFYQIPLIPAWGSPIVLLLGFHLFFEAVFLPFLIERRKGKMIEQLAVAIDYMARGLQVGQSIESAIYDAAQAVDRPMKDKLLMVHKLTEVGISLPNALETVAVDIDLAEFDFFVSAVTAQLQSGGSIVNSLLNIVEIVRARKELKAKVAALSAEGKMSAYVLTCLPVGIYVYLKLVRPEYLRPLDVHAAGPYILWGAVALVVVGFVVMMRLAKIKV